ncbi:MAG: helix-turn-helix transcriptional regulator [Palaeococcus sp.]|uniref:ArsR/SmtB family transcription factor n=1 Tax=Palaeococcus sp. (in: euryarchaeotes) TaxID=2820298 RepID=UPI0025EC4E13|nr:winged helix-turn-helix domain-containing protein [Palaeococcus sp. (in: euryarchaeotes)]MCD6558572.1 helix-turn-helix transcriptional regulator [Palaeococcus sp. (in: euryarchaeotes)]
MVEFETIDVGDEKARELAQIIMNDKALSILKLLQEERLSASDISERLDIPLSTVVYHLDKMTRVGLIEVAGKRYGKRLQEVKLYRASPKPILLMPAKTSFKKRVLRTIEKIQVISLSIAGLIAYGVYKLSNALFFQGISRAPLENATVTAPTTTETSKMFAVNTTPKAVEILTNSTTSTTMAQTLRISGAKPNTLSIFLAVLSFIGVVLFLNYYLSKRNL